MVLMLSPWMNPMMNGHMSQLYGSSLSLGLMTPWVDLAVVPSSIKTATSWDFTVTSPRMVAAFRIVQHQIPSSMLVTRLHRFNIWRRGWVVLIMLAYNSRLGVKFEICFVIMGSS